MRKSLLVKTALIVAGLLFLFLIYQARQTKEEDKKAREQLQEEISRQISLYKSGEAKTIDLSKIESFLWDRLYIFGPYASLDIIQERLGYSWRPSIPTILGADTSFNLLVFTYEGKVVRYVDYPRVLGEFSGAGDEAGNGYEPNEAKFVINEYGYILWINQ